MFFPVFQKETMEDIDKNGDGFIDLEEYIGMLLWGHAVWELQVEIFFF